jgi:ferredoxin
MPVTQWLERSREPITGMGQHGGRGRRGADHQTAAQNRSPAQVGAPDPHGPGDDVPGGEGHGRDRGPDVHLLDEQRTDVAHARPVGEPRHRAAATTTAKARRSVVFARQTACAQCGHCVRVAGSAAIDPGDVRVGAACGDRSPIPGVTEAVSPML